MDPNQSHSNSKRLDSMYHRNLTTRQKSIDKDFFDSTPSPPEALRQKPYHSEILNDSDVNIISAGSIPNSPASIPFFDKSNQKEISENSSFNHDKMSYVTMRKKCESSNNSNSSLRNISESRTSSENERNKMGSENEHSNKDCENEHINMDREHEHNNQSVYILFPKNQKNGVKIEELKMFIGGNLSSSSKRKILNEFFNQQNPRASFSSTSHLKNNKAISAKKSSPFSRILEKTLKRLNYLQVFPHRQICV